MSLLVRSFSYIPLLVQFSEEFLLALGSFSYTPDASFSEEFPLHYWC